MDFPNSNSFNKESECNNDGLVIGSIWIADVPTPMVRNAGGAYTSYPPSSKFEVVDFDNNDVKVSRGEDQVSFDRNTFVKVCRLVGTPFSKHRVMMSYDEYTKFATGILVKAKFIDGTEVENTLGYLTSRFRDKVDYIKITHKDFAGKYKKNLNTKIFYKSSVSTECSFEPSITLTDAIEFSLKHIALDYEDFKEDFK